MAQFFIDRPIFAWVIALFILVGGARRDHAAAGGAVPAGRAAVDRRHRRLPRRLGADAGGERDQRHRAGDERLAGPDLHGVGHARPTAAARITLSFQPGTNPDLAQVDVQNRLSRATPRLPQAVTQQGVRVDKARSNFLMFTILSSDDPACRPDRARRLRRRATCCPRSSACPASARRSCSAPNARCASGSTRPSWSASTCRRPTSTPPIRAPERAGVVGHHRRPAQRAGAGASSPPWSSRASSPRVEQFGNIVLRANADGSACACATWRASSSARRTTPPRRA